MTGTISNPRHGGYWTDGDVRSGIAGRRRESWLEVSAVRGTVAP